MINRKNSFKSRYKTPKLLKIVTILIVLVCISLWVTASKTGLDRRSLLFFTGITLLICDVAYMNRNKVRDINNLDKHLEKNRSEIGNGDYNSDIFFNKED